MSTLLHDQGTTYVLMPYRERIQANTARELKRQLRALSRQFGAFVSIEQESDHSYWVALSNTPGVLIAELLIDAKPAQALVYVEPYDETQCLLVVTDGAEVVMDRLIARERLFDYIEPHAKRFADQTQAELLWVTGMEWSSEEQTRLSQLAIPVCESRESLWRGRDPQGDSRLTLQTIHAVLGQTHTPWYRRPWSLSVAAAVVIAVLAVSIHHIQAPAHPVFVRQATRDVASEMASQPSASETLDAISDTVIRLQEWPGVSVRQVKYMDSQLRVTLALKPRLQRHAWHAWVKKHGFDVSLLSGQQERLKQDLLLPAQRHTKSVLSAQAASDAVSDAVALASGEADVLVTHRERYGHHALIQLKLRIRGMSAARLSLLADSIRRYPIVLHRLMLRHREHRLWGSLSLTVWGYVS